MTHIRILEDRSPLRWLSGQHPTLFRHLSELGRGRTDERDRLHFCGLVQPPGEAPAIFLPREALQNDFSEDLATAKLTMRTLAKFSYSSRTRTDISAFGPQGISQLGVVLDLAADYRDYGIYCETERYPTIGSGKPNWSKTLRREFGFYDENGELGPPLRIRGQRSLDSHSSALSQISSFCAARNFSKPWLVANAVRAARSFAKSTRRYGFTSQPMGCTSPPSSSIIVLDTCLAAVRAVDRISGRASKNAAVKPSHWNGGFPYRLGRST